MLTIYLKYFVGNIMYRVSQKSHITLYKKIIERQFSEQLVAGAHFQHLSLPIKILLNCFFFSKLSWCTTSGTSCISLYIFFDEVLTFEGGTILTIESSCSCLSSKREVASSKLPPDELRQC